jgi:hypothetical protein
LLLSKLVSDQNWADIVTQKSARLVPLVAGVSPPASGSWPLLTGNRLTSFVSNKMNYFYQIPALFSSVSFSGLIRAHLSIKNTMEVLSRHLLFCPLLQSAILISSHQYARQYGIKDTTYHRLMDRLFAFSSL